MMTCWNISWISRSTLRSINAKSISVRVAQDYWSCIFARENTVLEGCRKITNYTNRRAWKSTSFYDIWWIPVWFLLCISFLWYNTLYYNVTSVRIFIGCRPWSIKEHTHTDGVKSTSDHVCGLVFLFTCPTNLSTNQLNFYCLK